MPWDEIRGSWKEVYGAVRATWGKLTDDDVLQIDGERDRLVRTLQRRYGKSRHQVEAEVTAFERKMVEMLSGEEAKHGDFMESGL